MGNNTYIKRGFYIGLTITLIALICAAYEPPYSDYFGDKESYETRQIIINNCGKYPSEQCLKELYKTNPRNTIHSFAYYYNEYPGLRVDGVSDKDTSDIMNLLVPDIGEGLDFFLMFGPLGLLVFLLPIIIGILVGSHFKKKFS